MLKLAELQFEVNNFAFYNCYCMNTNYIIIRSGFLYIANIS